MRERNACALVRRRSQDSNWVESVDRRVICLVTSFLWAGILSADDVTQPRQTGSNDLRAAAPGGADPPSPRLGTSPTPGHLGRGHRPRSRLTTIAERCHTMHARIDHLPQLSQKDSRTPPDFYSNAPQSRSGALDRGVNTPLLHIMIGIRRKPPLPCFQQQMIRA